MKELWSGWDGVGTAAVTLVGSIACFTRIGQIRQLEVNKSESPIDS